jgi:putative endonuclease
MARTTDAKGRLAEAAAGWLLRLKGFRILETRFKTRVGEIDIIARRGDLLIFVEVKRRPGARAALESLSLRQRQRIVRAATLFLASRPGLDAFRCRFDLVSVSPWRLPAHLEGAWRL